MPEGLRPVCIQSRFMLATMRSAVLATCSMPNFAHACNLAHRSISDQDRKTASFGPPGPPHASQLSPGVLMPCT